MSNDKKALRLYIIIVFAISAVVETVWILHGEAATQAGISALLMMIPFAAALVIGRVLYKKQGALGFRRCKPVYILLAVTMPLVYLAPSYGLFWGIKNGAFTAAPSILIETAAAYSGQDLPKNAAIIISLLVTIPFSIITAFGEEAGWRGFMYPIMERVWGWKKALVISGFVWALWHLPIVIAGLYYPPDTNLAFLIPMFFIEIFALTVIITWLSAVSKSVWPAILFHAAHNYFDQIVFQSFTDSDKSVYFAGEIGVITLVLTVLIAAAILLKGRHAFNKANWLSMEK